MRAFSGFLRVEHSSVIQHVAGSSLHQGEEPLGLAGDENRIE
jgi:hypothetical protein